MSGAAVGVQAFYSRAITPSDSTVFEPPIRMLWVGVAGNLTLRLSGMSATILLSNVPVGMIDDLSIAQVMSTGTVATTMVGFW